jgi:integrase
MVMAKTGRLTALQVTRAKEPGMYADGGGLYLQVTSNGKPRRTGETVEPAKSWIFRYALRGKVREMGLGSLSAISLQDARAKVAECRKLRHEGIDPIDARRAEREQSILDAAKVLTFKDATDKYIAAHRSGWRNAKHAAQWESTLKTYAHPIIGAHSVQAIDTALVVKILEPIWNTKTETASRLRGRIEAVLDWATVRGYRRGDNPARWRGHLDVLLPKPSRVRAVAHHAALPYGEMPGFMAAVRAQQGVAARALEFTILTAARTGETLGATWDEINIAQKVWTIPASRMKAGKEHRVPLSTHALAILSEMKRSSIADQEFVFLGAKRGKSLSNMAMTMTLRRMDRADLTTHGFRSAFRDWGAESTNFSREVIEMALAHPVGDKVEAAYRRGDLFEKRRPLMEQWDEFCSGMKKSGKVVPIPVAASTA